MSKSGFPIAFAELSDDELTFAHGGRDNFGCSGLGTSIATLGLVDEPATRTRRTTSNVSEAWVDVSGRAAAPSGLALTENPDGTFSAVKVYAPTQTYDLTSLRPLAKPPIDGEFDLERALRILVG